MIKRVSKANIEFFSHIQRTLDVQSFPRKIMLIHRVFHILLLEKSKQFGIYCMHLNEKKKRSKECENNSGAMVALEEKPMPSYRSK